MDRKLLALIAAICGGTGIFATFLPWATWTGGLPGAGGSVNGYDVDTGAWVLILGGLGGAAALLVRLRKTALVPLDERQLLFLGTGTFGLATLLTLIRFFSGMYGEVGPGNLLGGNARGFGLILALLAMGAGCATSFLATRRRPVDTA